MSKRSVKCSVDYVEQREALCRLAYAQERGRHSLLGSTFRHCQALVCPSLGTPRRLWLLNDQPPPHFPHFASDDCSVDTPGSLPFTPSTLLPSFCFFTESNHCNEGALSWSCSVTVAFGFRQYKGREPSLCLHNNILLRVIPDCFVGDKLCALSQH